MKDNRFYIYVWIREDYNTIFYVGKGCDFRATCKQGRNRYFLNIVENIPTRMEKIYDNLTEKEAFDLEISTIHNLVYEQGYSIDIEGFEKIKGRHLVNKTWGGEGSSGRRLTEQEKKHLSEIKTGIANPKISEAMKEYHKTHEHHNAKKVVCLNTGIVYNSINEAERQTNICASVISENCKNNASYAGKNENEVFVWMNYEDFLATDEETIAYKLQHGKDVASKKGENNSFYGRKHSNETKEKLASNWTEDKLEEMISKQRCNKVHCIELNMDFISQSSAARYVNKTYGLKIKGQIIGQHCAKGEKSKGYGTIELNGEMTKLHWVYV